MKIYIQVRLFATLSRYMPENPDHFPIESDASVHDLLRHLGVPIESATLIFINGQRADVASILKEGERVGIFPPVGGG